MLRRINLNSQDSNTAPPRQRADYQEVIGHLVKRKKRSRSCWTRFSIPTFPSSTEFDSVRSNNSNNLKNRAQIMEAQGSANDGPFDSKWWHGWQDCRNVLRFSIIDFFIFKDFAFSAQATGV